MPKTGKKAEKGCSVHMDSELRDQFVREFRKLDHDKNGHLDKDEVRNNPLFKDFPEKDFNAIFNCHDTNGDGVMQLDEFLVFAWELHVTVTSMAICCKYDKNQDGKICKSELAELLRDMGSGDDPEKFLKKYDKDNSGYVTFDEIRNALLGY